VLTSRQAHTAHVADLFSALGDPTRRALIEQLARVGPVSASMLALDYDLTRQAIVKHLASLQAAGIVSSERHGNEVRYGLRPGALEGAAEWLERVGSQWDRRLVALNKRLANGHPNRS
jgi:DNA-binding transcriptional ArsR family regulator